LILGFHNWDCIQASLFFDSCCSPSATPVATPVVSPCPLRVYSRQRRRPCMPTPTTAVSDPIIMTLSPTTRDKLLDKVTKPVVKLIPQTVIQKRWSKAPPSGSLPHRSRHVAGAGPCSPGPVISDAQKRVIRSLGLSAVEKITSQLKTITASCLIIPFLMHTSLPWLPSLGGR
jgi:hypothetical protein